MIASVDIDGVHLAFISRMPLADVSPDGRIRPFLLAIRPYQVRRGDFFLLKKTDVTFVA